MTAAAPTLIQAWNDPSIFAPLFRDMASWQPWRTFGKALFGLPLDEGEIGLLRECTGRECAPQDRSKEAYLICGRRGGKSRFLALVIAYLASFVNWQPFLSPGERGYLVIIASDRRQCRTIMGYVRAFLGIELLGDLISKDTAEELELNNNLTVEVATCSFRTIRGRTVIAAACDEAAFWNDAETGANPASEVLASLRPAMATVPGAMLLIASSPYGKRGPLWDAYRKWWSKDAGPLVWVAPTWVMNPALPRDSTTIVEAFERDDLSARSEFGACFRDDLASYVSREVVEGCVVTGRLMLPPLTGVHYRAFVDPSGGASDSFTAAIAHEEGSNPKRQILDAVFEWRPPFSPEEVVRDLSKNLHAYGISRVIGDKYSGQFVIDLCRKFNITYESSAKPKTDLYRELLAALHSGTVELLDNTRLINQLISLERRTARSGKESIAEPPNAHDDVCNSVAGVLVGLGASRYHLLLENL